MTTDIEGHTPGPWQLDPERIRHGRIKNRGDITVLTEGFDLVATVKRRKPEPGSCWSNEEKRERCEGEDNANAELIARAPELLARVAELEAERDKYKRVVEKLVRAEKDSEGYNFATHFGMRTALGVLGGAHKALKGGE